MSNLQYYLSLGNLFVLHLLCELLDELRLALELHARFMRRLTACWTECLALHVPLLAYVVLDVV